MHLYSRSLDLYGDCQCLNALRFRIEEMGHSCVIDTQGLCDEIDTEGYDLVYISHGKCHNTAIVSKHFYKYKDKIISQINNGQCFFVTGSARMLFGNGFTTLDGEVHKGIGLFDYTAYEIDSVFTSDMLLRPVFAPEKYAYGFINRTEHITYPQGKNPSPLFFVDKGCSDDKTAAGNEGTLYKNFMATWCMGPALIRNPVLMRQLLARMLCDDYAEGDYSLEQTALDITVADLTK